MSTPKPKRKQSPRQSHGSSAELPLSGRASAGQLAKDIGRRIAEARNGLALSQDTVSGRCRMVDPDGQGVSRASLSLYETGVNIPGGREIFLLSKVLKVSPNWLLFGSESPADALQASVSFLQGSDLDLAVRLAFAIVALDPSDRDSLGALILSLLTKKLGDVQLSSLMAMASMLREPMYKELLDCVGSDAKNLKLRELIDRFVKVAGNSIYTQWGTLRPNMTEEQLDDYDPNLPPPPPRKLSDE